MILDLSKKEHIPMINMYKKCKGIALVDKYLPKLSPLNKMYIIDSMDDWEKVENEFPEKMMTARCDCPKGVNGKLPSGQTFNRDRVRGYIQEVKASVPNIFPLYLQHEKLSRDGLRSFGVEVNIVEDGTLVPMEIQVPDRFKEKDSNER